MPLEGGECSDMLGVEQGLRQGCVLAPLLFNMFFMAVLRVAEKFFIADAAIMVVQLQRRKEKGGRCGPVESTDSGKRRRPRCYGECCTLAMRAIDRDHQED